MATVPVEYLVIASPMGTSATRWLPSWPAARGSAAAADGPGGRQSARARRPRLRFAVPPSLPEDLAVLPHEIAGPVIGPGALADLDVIHGPRQGSPVTYDAWLAVLREANPRFAFTDPPFRRSLPITLAFAARTSRPTAVLTGPHHCLADCPGPAEPDPAADPAGLVRARIDGSPLTAAAALVWSGDLPRPLQQVLFDTADAAGCVGI
jgi:hypothetical protein